jgi:hypothetical protein
MTTANGTKISHASPEVISGEHYRQQFLETSKEYLGTRMREPNAAVLHMFQCVTCIGIAPDVCGVLRRGQATLALG